MAEKNFIMRIREDRLLDFKAVAELKGVSMSTLVHQHIVELIREEKQRDPSAFLRALQQVMENEKARKGEKVEPENKGQRNNIPHQGRDLEAGLDSTQPHYTHVLDAGEDDSNPPNG